MARVQLLGGAYSARSVIANAQRCINYFPELNRRDAPVPFTFYQRPGFRQLVDSGIPAPVRGLYQASNGNGYCVIGPNVYSVSPDFVLTLLGSLISPGDTPVSMIDNSFEIMLVDGSPQGYQIDLTTNVFSQIDDPTGAFIGATRVDYLDTFIVWNYPGSYLFGSTLSGEIVFDALYVAGKVAYPDPIGTLIVNRHELILLGSLKSEIWYDAGNAQFPFAELPGSNIEHGIWAPYSVASADIETFWLSSDLQGQGVVFALKGYDARRISNHALEDAIQKMPSTKDAIGYTYQQQGHVFYVLCFPTGNQTWVYDASLGDDPTMAWHQRAWTDSDGNLNRDRSNCFATLYGKNVVGDWQSGVLYQLDPSYYYDDSSGVPGPISYVKGFPHIQSGYDYRTQQQTEASGKNMKYTEFLLDFEVGTTDPSPAGSPPADPPQVWLRWSDNKGVSFGNALLQSAGAPGEYKTQPQWQSLGLARDMIFEIGHSIPGPAALNGAWIEATVLNQ